ncbi:GFA family protein [Vogesella oryzae]|uniref:GFA family protein n=1 Tax=Vogesella oryzae TaxID=1735285 RepID=UPI001583DB22|nr:GFA family protein [Vogesella oryzae]
MQQFEGACQCGQLRYRVRGTVAALFACHCRDCQRQSASAFGMALWLRDAELTLLQGSTACWARHTPGGRVTDCRFCPQCGSRLFHQNRDTPQFLSIKPGSLDDTSWLRPAAHIWTQSAQPWLPLPAEVPGWPGNPDDFAELMAAWQAAPHDCRG